MPRSPPLRRAAFRQREDDISKTIAEAGTTALKAGQRSRLADRGKVGSDTRVTSTGNAVQGARMARGGKAVFGARLGILMLEARFPRIPGDMGNASTWPFPVLYKVVRGASPQRVVRERAAGLLPAFLDAAKELVDLGADGITTNCGFLSLYQDEIARHVGVPSQLPAYAGSVHRAHVAAGATRWHRDHQRLNPDPRTFEGRRGRSWIHPSSAPRANASSPASLSATSWK